MQRELTIERLRQLLRYDPATGVLVWLVKRRGLVEAGAIAGCLDKGYVRIQVDGRLWFAHVLAFALAHGRWPDGEVDHRNNVRNDNRLLNLRDATAQVNRQNLKAACGHNKHSRLLGVHHAADHPRTPWRAAIVVDGRRKHLGYFTDPQLAHEAYIAAKRIYHEGNTL